MVGARARVRARAWAEAGYVVGPEVMGNFIKDSIHKVFGVLPTECFSNMRIVLVKVGACVLERKNLMASPFTSPLKTLLGWEEAKWRYWNVLVGLKYVFRSRRLVWENLSPLWMFRSRNCTRVSEMFHVNLMLGCTLLSLSKKPSSWLLDPVQMQRMSVM